MNQELETILELHRKWIMKKPGGSRANLTDANLTGADLYSANLTGANLTDANLTDANLYSANLTGASLTGADLTGANLTGANLTGAYLTDAKLDPIRGDFFSRLEKAKSEAPGLYHAIMTGKINGSSYEDECACFVGTIAHIRKEQYQELGIDLKPDATCATERWFMGIRQGDIPQNNQVSAITAEWMREFMTAKSIKFPRYEIVAVNY